MPQQAVAAGCGAVRAPLSTVTNLLSTSRQEKSGSQKASQKAPDCAVESLGDILKSATISTLDGDDGINSDDLIDRHLKQLELVNRPATGYIQRQKQVDTNIRSLMVDWMVEMADGFKLEDETLFLAVNYMDRVLSAKHVPRHRLQLLCLVAVFIASKYEEVAPCRMSDLVDFCDEQVSRHDIFAMEFLILGCLQFRLNAATVHCFASRFLPTIAEAMQCDSDKLTSLTAYLSELSLLSYEMLQYSPSLIAISSIVLAFHTLRSKQFWHPIMESVSGHSFGDMSNCITLLHRLYAKAANWPYQCTRRRFKSKTRNRVANIRPRRSEPKL